MKFNFLLLATGGLVLAGAPAAWASGFQVYLGGQKNNGMGGVGVGLSLDQAAMFYNPGALAMVRKNGVTLGANASFARVAFRAESGGSEQRNLDPTTTTPFGFYAAFGPKEGKFKVGVAAYTPFGSKLDYADGWEGRYALTQIDLKSIYVQPTVSYAITPQISVGAGLTILAYGAVNLQRDVLLPNNTNGSIELDGKAKTKFGVNAGIMFRPSEKFSVGLNYKSKIDAVVEEGDVKLKNLTTGTGQTLPIFDASFTATRFGAILPLPATASIGIGVSPTEKLTLGAGVIWTEWSAYRTLDFTFSGDNGAAGVIGGRNLSTSKRDYQDVLAFRLGGQYKVTDQFTVRAGAAFDQSPVRDGYVTPETPDNDRLILTTGLSYGFNENFGVDVSYQFLQILKRTQTQQQLLDNGTADRVAGTYNTYIHLPGLGLYYNF